MNLEANKQTVVDSGVATWLVMSFAAFLALLSASCYVLPIGLSILGLGGAWPTMLGPFIAYRAFILGAVAIALVWAWYRVPRCRFTADFGRVSDTDGVRDIATEEAKIVLDSTLTCPSYGHVETETMPTDACQWFYECNSCQTVLKPLEGDCCVYCSFATVPCPPIQEGKSCC